MFLEEIAARLASQGVGVYSAPPAVTPGTNIFLSSKAVIPVGAGPYLTITDTGGSSGSGTQNDTAVENATAQLMVRAGTYPAAYAMLKAAFTALGGQNGLFNVTLSGVKYLKIKARQNPTDTGLDADPTRVTVAFNIDAEKQPS